jgi:hypothetical protein
MLHPLPNPDHHAARLDHSDEELTIYFLTGVLGRALAEIDGERGWSTGRVPLTLGQRHEALIVAVLKRELRRLATVST